MGERLKKDLVTSRGEMVMSILESFKVPKMLTKKTCHQREFYKWVLICDKRLD